jgi:hypothetical protein
MLPKRKSPDKTKLKNRNLLPIQMHVAGRRLLVDFAQVQKHS